MATIYVADQLHEYNEQQHADILQLVPKYEYDQSQSDLKQAREEIEQYKTYIEAINSAREFRLKLLPDIVKAEDNLVRYAEEIEVLNAKLEKCKVEMKRNIDNSGVYGLLEKERVFKEIFYPITIDSIKRGENGL